MKKIPDNEIILYTLPQSTLSIEVIYANENVWLTKKKIAELYEVDRSVISKHLKNIYNSRELDEGSTCADFAQVQKEGERSIARTIPIKEPSTTIPKTLLPSSIFWGNYRSIKLFLMEYMQ